MPEQCKCAHADRHTPARTCTQSRAYTHVMHCAPGFVAHLYCSCGPVRHSARHTSALGLLSPSPSVYIFSFWASTVLLRNLAGFPTGLHGSPGLGVHCPAACVFTGCSLGKGLSALCPRKAAARRYYAPQRGRMAFALPFAEVEALNSASCAPGIRTIAFFFFLSLSLCLSCCWAGDRVQWWLPLCSLSPRLQLPHPASGT